jgi:major membrane immunogen (membrane-anchored lipoprotein)
MLRFLIILLLLTGCSKEPVHRDYYRDGNFEHHYKHEGHRLPPQQFPPR